jgi:oxygen-independent coproporphyrinogen-3 oxidase
MGVDSNKFGGIYVHIPFCVRKCPYCDFYSITDLALKPKFLKALRQEIDRSHPRALVFDTLYLGGGTPSLLSVEAVGQIIKDIDTRFHLPADVEVTLETNPGTLSLESLRDYRRAGINRLNIGVQSFQDSHLNFLKRIHSAGDAVSAFEWARRAGFENLGLDLIYGLPQQTRKNWLVDLVRAVELAPEHMSCYMLSCEPGTPLHQDLQNKRFQPLEEGKIRELFDLTGDYLESRGYRQYEVSNFARQNGIDHRSRHNLKYWFHAPYIGLGPSAHSFIEPQRYWNYPDVQKYVAEVEGGRSPVAGEEILSKEQLMMEVIYLGLRTISGIDLFAFHRKFEVDFLQTFREIIADLENCGYLQVARGRCSLTREGLAFLDNITSRFTSTPF